MAAGRSATPMAAAAGGRGQGSRTLGAMRMAMATVLALGL